MIIVTCTGTNEATAIDMDQVAYFRSASFGGTLFFFSAGHRISAKESFDEVIGFLSDDESPEAVDVAADSKTL